MCQKRRRVGEENSHQAQKHSGTHETDPRNFDPQWQPLVVTHTEAHDEEAEAEYCEAEQEGNVVVARRTRGRRLVLLQLLHHNLRLECSNQRNILVFRGWFLPWTLPLITSAARTTPSPPGSRSRQAPPAPSSAVPSSASLPWPPPPSWFTLFIFLHTRIKIKFWLGSS